MENSSSQEVLVRLSRMVENDRRMELVSVTTCKQPQPAGDGVSTGVSAPWDAPAGPPHHHHPQLLNAMGRFWGAASLGTVPQDDLSTDRGQEGSGLS